MDDPYVVYDTKLGRYFLHERHRWLVIKLSAGPLCGVEPAELAQYELRLQRET